MPVGMGLGNAIIRILSVTIQVTYRPAPEFISSTHRLLIPIGKEANTT